MILKRPLHLPRIILRSLLPAGAVLFLCAQTVWAQPSASPGDATRAATGDAAFAAARDAFADGDQARLEQAARQLGDHPLADWGAYFVLVRRLDTLPPREIEAFLARQEGTFLAEKLRGDWVRSLARRGDWSGVLARFATLQQPDAGLRCHALHARLRLNQAGVIEQALAFLDDESTALPEACLAPLGRLAASGQIPADAIWLRLRQQVLQGRMKEARTVADWLPAGEAPNWQAVESAHDHPARYLKNLPENFAASRQNRELAMLAAVRMARADVRIAQTRWRELEKRFTTSERAWVRTQIAHRAALNHLPEAGAWFNEAIALGANLTEAQLAWRVRSFLRRSHWPDVARAIDELPEAMSNQPEWIYWRGRAYQSAGRMDAARTSWQRIADQPNFYGILATEALGRRFAVPPAAAAPTADEMAAASGRVGLVRGLALIRADMRTEGVREWNWALRGADDRMLLAAAELARRQGVLDRSISAAERTRQEHSFALRYPTPFYAEVAPVAGNVGVDTAWVYGLIRQESRFIMDARSRVGAQGLMQLMPATARYVARKIGMDDFRPGRVNELDVNIALGTSYLRMVLDNLDSHPVLASAAYNAGPGRARRWRAEVSLEGSIYAETIPFNETRDYVKKVMANTIVYSALKNGSTPSLVALMGTIRPRGFGDARAEDLP